jgi:pilus assembly protein Flp/PilA
LAKAGFSNRVYTTLGFAPYFSGRSFKGSVSGWDRDEKKMKALLVRFLKDETGATAIEYGLIACGIALALIAILKQLGLTLEGIFTSLTNMLGPA